MTKKIRVFESKSPKTALVAVALLFLAAGAGAQPGTLFVEGDQVGIGTSSPEADLEIFDNLDFAALRLNNTTATFAFAVNVAGQFTVNKIGSGGQEFSLNTRFNGDGVPTLQVQGSVSGTNFKSTSSRDLKTDFSLLDGREVLANLAEIPLMSWRYKQDGTGALHVGPMAEDFQAAFQLGDGKTITNIDADGIALAAIQGLYSEIQDRDAEIEELKARLAQLESLLSDFAAAQN